MTPPDLADLDLMESAELPARTMVAPLSIIREIRLAPGVPSINLLVGTEDVVLVSSDLFEAYNEWDGQRTDIDPNCN
jgi:hypothetical protein